MTPFISDLLSRARSGLAHAPGARLAAALAVALTVGATDAGAAIGTGSRTMSATFDGVRFTIYTYRPECPNPDILFVHHGTGRDADRYRDSARQVADSQCMVVIAPLYPESQFTSDQYNRGNVYPGVSPGQWTVRFEKPMIDWAVRQIGGTPGVYLFGHSAGGQFLSRVAGYVRPKTVRRYVVGNPSTHVWPSLTEAIPYGFDRLSTDAAERRALQEYLALPVTIYLGSLDNDPNDPDLSTSAPAMRQGSTRLERGRNAFAEARRVAAANGWKFGWALVIAEGVAHSGGGMLKSGAMLDALGPGATSPYCACPM